ncbi:hypothetical protein FACS1894190_01130 [Spirochaetia bacterium]|nr:hypothetical protein FACS1894190_01130 [Spirochaetia bacterium]
MPIEVRIYDYLFTSERPMDVEHGKTFLDNINPNSLTVIEGAFGEPSLAVACESINYQFERQGYFIRDTGNSGGKPVFNKTIGLRDTWAKINKG